jgi:hypothetical protein
MSRPSRSGGHDALPLLILQAAQLLIASGSCPRTRLPALHPLAPFRRRRGKPRNNPAPSGARKRSRTSEACRYENSRPRHACARRRRRRTIPFRKTSMISRMQLARRINRFLTDRRSLWRRCPLRACRRAHACSTREMRRIVLAREPRKPSSETDRARAMTLVRRAVERALEQCKKECEATAATPETASPRASKNTQTRSPARASASNARGARRISPCSSTPAPSARGR